MQWSDDALTVVHDAQGFNATSGAMDIEVHGSITASGEEWLRIVVQVLAMLPGKPDSEGTGYLVGPVGVEADMIGELVATMLRDRPPFR